MIFNTLLLGVYFTKIRHFLFSISVTGRSAVDAKRTARHGVQAASANRLATPTPCSQGAEAEVPEGAGSETAEGAS